MDSTLLKSILSCCNEVKDSTEYKNFSYGNKYIPTSKDVFNLLSTALTNVLYCKISKEAYQHYSVRTNVIDTLRRWCTVEPIFQPIYAFRKEEAVLKLVKNLTRQYLTTDLIEKCTDEDTLISLSGALMCLSEDNTDFSCYIETIIDRLTKLQSTDKLDNFFSSIINRADLIDKLRKPVIENIYITSKYKLVEDIILDNFISESNINNEKDKDQDNNSQSLERVLQFAATSSSVFGLVFSFLRELFIYMNYEPAVLKYTQIILQKILVYCNEQNIDVLSLYPRHLHSCVLLIRIKPQYHTPDSTNYTLELLERIHMDSIEESLVLLLHYPEWQRLFSQYLKQKLSCDHE